MGFEQFRRELTITSETGDYVNGYWQADAGQPTTSKITASVQPANDKQRKNLPEGFDVDSVLELGTESALYVAERGGKRLSDKVTIDGQLYDVIRLERWQNTIISHRWYIIALRDNE
jgi:hypothetical protein